MHVEPRQVPIVQHGPIDPAAGRLRENFLFE
jgi:hypothetical protein